MCYIGHTYSSSAVRIAVLTFYILQCFVCFIKGSTNYTSSAKHQSHYRHPKLAFTGMSLLQQ